MPESHNPVTEKLIHAYDQMLETTKEFLDTTGKEAKPAILDAIDKSKEKLAELTELTAEDIDKVSDFVVRDIHHAAEYIAEGERELGDWLRLDALYLEDKFMEAFSNMVDHTQLALEELRQNAIRATEWHTGEITGPGTLFCASCGEALHFKKTGHIPPCPKCHHTVYNRNED